MLCRKPQARRALRALKGLVRLQALIRGQAVRRQTAATLRGLESLMRIQARHRSRAGGIDHHHLAADDDAQLLRRGRELFAAVHVSDTLFPCGPASRMNGTREMIGAAHARHVGNCWPDRSRRAAGTCMRV